MKKRNKTALLFIIVALGCLTLLAISINQHYQNFLNKEKQAQLIKDRLILLKEFQEAYHGKYRAYASTWNQLFKFINEENFYITDIKEKIIPNPPYSDSIVVQIDTINIIPVKDSLLNGKLIIEELNNIPGSEMKFSIQAKNLSNYSLFEIEDTDPNTPKITQKGVGKIPFKVGSMDRPTTKPNWK